MRTVPAEMSSLRAIWPLVCPAATRFRDVRLLDRVLPVTFEGGPEQLAATLAAAGVASELEALSPRDKERLHDAVTELSRPLMADGALQSQLASHLAIARR
jgi:hypothetical protein